MKADLHIHTNFSYDGASSPQEIVKAAIEKDMNCICITDHGEIKGAIEAMKFAYDKNILVIPGIEILTTSGDILGINIKKVIPNNLSIEETIKEIRKQGGMAVIPHPFVRPMFGFFGGERKFRKVDIDAVEVFNASLIFNFANKNALALSRKNNLCFTAGSDAHRAEFVGRGYIEISKNIFSEKDVLEEIRNKRVKVRGTHLNFLEVLKNYSKTNVKNIINYCRLKGKNSSKQKNSQKIQKGLLS